MGWLESTNQRIAASPVGHWFRLDGCGHPKERKHSRFSTEIRAGITAFCSMSYILAVNSSIVADTGGVCQVPDGEPLGFKSDSYRLCQQSIKRDAVTATAAIAALGSFCMGLFANLPIGLAPGMGLNAYFAYTVVGINGTGGVPYRVALTAVFCEGFIFFGLALLGMRQWLARAIPRSIKLATGAGIGLFLTMIGLTYSEGIGLVTGATATPTELAGCHPENMKDGVCPSWDKMRNPTLWVAVFCGGILTVILTLYRVRGAIICGIVLVSIISWPRNSAVTYFPHTSVGDDSFNFFKKVVSFHPIKKILNVQEWNISEYSRQFGLALITFLYVDILDATGTMYSLAGFANLIDPITQDFEGSSAAYMIDALSISIGAVFGVPPVTAFVESAAGISDGGKTGLTSMTTGLCFLIAVFFAPIFASIPPWATGCVLILVGSMMASAAKDVNWSYAGDAVPAFLTIALMPFTYSIANGLIGGICSYIVINTFVWLVKKATGGRVAPPNLEEKDDWTWRIPGGFFPPWLIRLCQGKKDFWREDTPPTLMEESGRPNGKLSSDHSGSEAGQATGTPVIKG